MGGEARTSCDASAERETEEGEVVNPYRDPHEPVPTPSVPTHKYTVHGTRSWLPGPVYEEIYEVHRTNWWFAAWMSAQLFCSTHPLGMAWITRNRANK